MQPTPDAVRREVGGIPEDVEEILGTQDLLEIIDDERSLYGAAARTAEIISRYYAHKADESLGDHKQWFIKRASNWQALAIYLRRRASTVAVNAVPYFGGISLADKEFRNSDTDRPKSDFYRDMWEDRWT